MASYRVFDIETVVDTEAWTPPAPKFVLSNGPVMVVEDAPAFPPPQAHRVVAISWVDLSGDDNEWYFYESSKSLCTWDHGDPDAQEHKLLSEFIGAEEEDKAIMVTWNGRVFDLPVVNLRALKHRIPMGFYYQDRDVRYRYSESGHLDLMDFFSDYGAARSMKLDDVARVIGLPGKTGPVSGNNVADFYAKGDSHKLMDQVGKYCLSDTIQTALLFIRSRFHKGMIDEAHHDKAIKSFMGKKEISDALPDGFDLKTLLVGAKK